MKAIAYARRQVDEALELLDRCVEDIDEGQYNWKPSGTCNPISKLHAHVLATTDFFATSLLQGQAPTWSEVASKAGLPPNMMEIWGSDATISLSVMRDYAKTLRESVLAYIDSLSDEDLSRQVETRFRGTQNVGWVLQLIGSHTANHTDEISAVKGMQGLKGLPF